MEKNTGSGSKHKTKEMSIPGRTVLAGSVAALALMTLMAAILWIYSRHMLSQIGGQGSGEEAYERHYAMVCGEYSDLWMSVYDCARESAAREHVYLEWTGMGSLADLTLEDRMRIAVSSRVDGIILQGNTAADLTGLIQEAAQAHIPVITVLGDDAGGDRISFIGINSYQMGELYGRQILDCLREGMNRILVLLDEEGNDTHTSLMQSQMIQTVETEKPEDCQVAFTTHEVNTSSSFGAEEDIRDIFVRRDVPADILICLDPVSTECALQALVDYNEVGNVSIIGYYASDAILDGIEKGLISATMRIDPEEIGNLCIEALEEYWSLGYVSNYFNIGLEMITREQGEDAR